MLFHQFIQVNVKFFRHLGQKECTYKDLYTRGFSTLKLSYYNNVFITYELYVKIYFM